jgi:hypothetical protein
MNPAGVGSVEGDADVGFRLGTREGCSDAVAEGACDIVGVKVGNNVGADVVLGENPELTVGARLGTRLGRVLGCAANDGEGWKP